MPEFYEDIFDYLENTENYKPVTPKWLDELIYKVCAYTELDYDSAALVTKYFFQEIRKNVLKGDHVVLDNLGAFTSVKDKPHIVRFRTHSKLKQKLNG